MKPDAGRKETDGLVSVTTKNRGVKDRLKVFKPHRAELSFGILSLHTLKKKKRGKKVLLPLWSQSTEQRRTKSKYGTIKTNMVPS